MLKKTLVAVSLISVMGSVVLADTTNAQDTEFPVCQRTPVAFEPAPQNQPVEGQPLATAYVVYWRGSSEGGGNYFEKTRFASLIQFILALEWKGIQYNLQGPNFDGSMSVYLTPKMDESYAEFTDRIRKSLALLKKYFGISDVKLECVDNPVNPNGGGIVTNGSGK